MIILIFKSVYIFPVKELYYLLIYYEMSLGLWKYFLSEYVMLGKFTWGNMTRVLLMCLVMNIVVSSEYLFYVLLFLSQVLITT